MTPTPDAPTGRTTAPDSECWQDVLDALDAEMDATAASLGRGLSPSGEGHVPPAGMPPLPAQLRERAWAVYDRTRAVVEALTRAADAAQDELRSVGAVQAGRPPASYVDRHC